MMSLYEIDAAIMQAFESAVDPETGEIFDLQAYQELDRLEMLREQKIENLLCYYKNLQAEATALKKESKTLAARQKAAERQSESIKDYVAKALDGEKFKTTKAAVSWRKSESAVYVGDVNKLPEECIRRAQPEVAKDNLKKLLKSGIEIDGASLVVKNNMSIK